MEVKLKPCPFCGADNKPTGSSRSGVDISRQKSINNWPRSSSERGQ